MRNEKVCHICGNPCTNIHNGEHLCNYHANMERDEKYIHETMCQMRCCGNCGHFEHAKYEDYVCDRLDIEHDPWDVCEHWGLRLDRTLNY